MSPFLFLYYLFLVFWSIRTIKAILFWLYLWQLKEYHVGRFLDYFRTQQGKTIFLNIDVVLKILLLGGAYLVAPVGIVWFLGIFILYAVEGGIAAARMIQRKLLLPVFTIKTIIIFLALLVLTFLFFLLFPLPYLAALFGSLLLYDLLIPLIVSAVVLAFQPFAAFGRNRILAKARAKRATMRNLKVIGITGSYGKTSTKEILAHILASKFRVAKTKEHQNSEVGVSRAILDELILKHEVFVCEMGAYNKGGIRLLASIAQPQIAVLLGANEQHLATFGSMENLLSAEGGKELVDALPIDGVAIFNGANIHAKKLYQETTKKKILTGPEGALSAEEVKAEQEKITFWVRTHEGSRVFFEAPLLGAHNAENVLLAAAAALELGMTLEEIARVCRTIPQSAGAMTLKRGERGLYIIDSSYSANPSGVLADLEYLKVWQGKKIVVMPSLIELGDASKDAHLKIGKKMAEVCDLAIITTQDHISDIQEGAGRNRDKIMFLGSWEQIVKRVQSFCQAGLPAEASAQAGDVVLLEGRVSPHIMQYLTS